MDKIRIIFILSNKYTDESEASDIMLQAYEACVQNIKNVSWIKESDFETIDFSKTDFVIFEDFEGINFEKLKETKCARILGPWCVAVCLMEGKPIPNFPWPIYNVAMADCIVTCSYLSKSLKLDIKEKVQRMGGCYTETLMSTNTHLVTDSVKTEKYSHAAEMGLRIMLPSWVDAVWNASKSGNIHCNDDQFTKYKVPPFHNLTICSTGFTKQSDRDELNKLISENGGELTGRLTLATTSVLVCKGVEGSTSQKYKAARNVQNIKCVTLDWILDSIERGYSLPDTNYQVQKGQSTPDKGKEWMNPNFSVMSAIIPSGNENKTSLEETISLSGGDASRIQGSKRKGSPSGEHGQLVDSIDFKKAKRAGQYLDGCSIYVAGFDGEHREKLCKILNLSGATRYDDINERLTHVIIGDINCPDVKVIRNRGYPCALVTVKWLIESIEKQQAVNEEEHLISVDSGERGEFSSPLSKKGLKLLKSNKTITENDLSMQIEPLPTSQPVEEIDIMQQYLSKAAAPPEEDTLAQLLKNDSKFQSIKDPELSKQVKKAPEPSMRQSTLMSQDETSQPCDIFEGLKFLLVGFNAEHSNILREQIESVLGEVVSKSYKGIADFAVLPVFNNSELKQTTTEVVNDMWITECIQEGKLREVQYYHKPFVLHDTTPLTNCVITCSGYPCYEKNFLRTLIEALGGICQDQFARITSVEKNIIGSTHLINVDGAGKKYLAALKWGLPVVTTEWLLECARTGTFVLEKDYLLGDSKAPERPQSILNLDKPNATPKPSGSSVSTPKSCFKNPADAPSSASGIRSRTGTPSTITMPSIPDSRILTPINQKLNTSNNPETPVNRKLNMSSDGCSQVTPVHKIMEEVRKTKLLGTPENSPVVYDNYFNIKTPETPLERCLTPNPNKELRKQLQRYINQFPDFVQPQRRLSTPLSELKKRLWNKIGQSHSSQSSDGFSEPIELNFDHENVGEVENVDVVSENPTISNKLQLLEDMMSNNSGGNRRASRNFQSTVPTEVANAEIKDSQAFTVGWDYRETASKNQQNRIKIFMFSGIESNMRQHYVEQVESLGGIVSELANYDPSSTHLVCPKPQRNEKSLSCMAAGKWILHISYIEKSVAAGKFLDEEEFEYGNPKSIGNIPKDNDVETRVNAMHYWRKEITRRGYGAFNDMRAIVVAEKREQLVRVLEAGGAVVLDMSPPFDEALTIHATHCLLEYRSNGIEKLQQYAPLAKQGIYCVNTTYISEFLHRTSKDIRDCIVPVFSKFYARK